MSASNTTSRRENQLADLPTFDLSYRFDNKEDLNLVTIYSEADYEITTHWISADIDSTINLPDIA